MKQRLKSRFCLSAAYLVGISTLPAATLITVDVSDPTAVVFTATAAHPTRDETERTPLDGISLMNFSSTPNAYGADMAATVGAAGAPPFDHYVFIDAANTSFPGPGIDLNFYNSNFGIFMFFESSGPAFFGSVTVDFTDALVTLPAAGTTGEIRPGVGDRLTESIGTFAVIPEPSSSLLLLSGIVTCMSFRRR